MRICWLLFFSIIYAGCSSGKIASSQTLSDLERGRYLVENVAGCIGCHSQRDTKIYGLPLKPGTKGMGGAAFKFKDTTIYGKNITSDKEPDSGAGAMTILREL